MRKTKNAFTLIELLAVIVILAVIALIATPIILGIVEDAKKDAFLRSVELVISTTDIDIANKTFEENYTYDIVDGNVSNLELGIKNTTGMNGSITYDMEGKEEYAIHNGVYCVKKTSDMSKAEISDYKEGECELIIETPAKYFTYKNATDGISINVDRCISFFSYMGPSEEDVTSICNNEIFFDGKNLIQAFQIGYFPESFYMMMIDMGVITFNPLEYEIIDEQKCIDYFIENGPLPEEFAKLECSDQSFTLIEYINFLNEKSINDELYNINIDEMIQYGAIAENSFGKYEIAPACIDYFYEEYAFSMLEANYLCNDGTYFLPVVKAAQFVGNISANLRAEGIIDSVSLIEITGYSDEGPKDVVIPEYIDGKKVIAISDNAFSDMELTSVKFPNSVAIIRESAFSRNNLSGVLDLSNTQITNIRNMAFSDNEIEKIKFPTTLQNIEIGAFGNNKLSGELDLRNLSKLIYINGFNANQISSIKFPNNIKNHIVYIGNQAFIRNKLTGELDFTDLSTLDSIGEKAFEGKDDGSTNQITSIKFPNNIKSIGSYAFSYNQITNIDFQSDFRYVGRYAFCNSQLPTNSEIYQDILSLNTSAFTCNDPK